MQSSTKMHNGRKKKVQLFSNPRKVKKTKNLSRRVERKIKKKEKKSNNPLRKNLKFLSTFSSSLTTSRYCHQSHWNKSIRKQENLKRDKPYSRELAARKLANKTRKSSIKSRDSRRRRRRKQPRKKRKKISLLSDYKIVDSNLYLLDQYKII